MEYMTTKEAAELWGVKIRQVQALCEKGQISTALRLGNMWVIPKGTEKPIDGRTKQAKHLMKN
jgi:excisionase family DNA binding protein